MIDKVTDKQILLPKEKIPTIKRNIAIAIIALAALITTAQYLGHHLHQSFTQLNMPIPSYAIRVLQATALASITYVAYLALNNKEKAKEIASLKEALKD